MAKTNRKEKKLMNRIIFVFFAHKRYSCSLIKLRWNHWCRMDYFNDVLTNDLPVILLHCGKVWKTSPITRQHPPALWRINNWQTIWMNSTAGLKKHHSHLLQLPSSPHLHWKYVKMTCTRSSERTKEGRHQAQTDLQQITGAVRSPLMLQTLHHHPHHKETQKYWTQWLKTCDSNVCGHKIIWKTGFGLSEGLHWTLTGPPAVCLQSKQVCGWCSQHGTTLHLAASGQTRDLCEDPVCRLGSAFNNIIPSLLQPKLPQLSVPTSSCQCINSFLTDRQQLVRLGKFSSNTRTISTGAPQGCVLSPLLFSLYTNNCTSKHP